MGVDKRALAYPAQRQDGQRDEGNEEETQSAIGVDGPAQQQAKPAKVSVTKSGIRGAEGTKDTEEECRQEGNNEAINKGAERGATATTGGIAVNACCAAGEEVRHQTRQNQRNAKGRIEPGGKDCKADKSAEEGGNEPNENCVLGIREDDGRIQCGTRWNECLSLLSLVSPSRALRSSGPDPLEWIPPVCRSVSPLLPRRIFPWLPVLLGW